MSTRMWAAERDKTSQKDGKISRKTEQVSFDDEGSYLKKTSENGKVTAEFKKLPKIQSGASLQAETDEKKVSGMKKGGIVKKSVAKPSKAKVKTIVGVKPRSKTIKKR